MTIGAPLSLASLTNVFNAAVDGMASRVPPPRPDELYDAGVRALTITVQSEGWVERYGQAFVDRVLDEILAAEASPYNPALIQAGQEAQGVKYQGRLLAQHLMQHFAASLSPDADYATPKAIRERSLGDVVRRDHFGASSPVIDELTYQALSASGVTSDALLAGLRGAVQAALPGATLDEVNYFIQQLSGAAFANPRAAVIARVYEIQKITMYRAALVALSRYSKAELQQQYQFMKIGGLRSLFTEEELSEPVAPAEGGEEAEADEEAAHADSILYDGDDKRAAGEVLNRLVVAVARAFGGRMDPANPIDRQNIVDIITAVARQGDEGRGAAPLTWDELKGFIDKTKGKSPFELQGYLSAVPLAQSSQFVDADPDDADAALQRLQENLTKIPLLSAIEAPDALRLITLFAAGKALDNADNVRAVHTEIGGLSRGDLYAFYSGNCCHDEFGNDRAVGDGRAPVASGGRVPPAGAWYLLRRLACMRLKLDWGEVANHDLADRVLQAMSGERWSSAGPTAAQLQVAQERMQALPDPALDELHARVSGHPELRADLAAEHEIAPGASLWDAETLFDDVETEIVRINGLEGNSEEKCDAMIASILQALRNRGMDDPDVYQHYQVGLRILLANPRGELVAGWEDRVRRLNCTTLGELQRTALPGAQSTWLGVAYQLGHNVHATAQSMAAQAAEEMIQRCFNDIDGMEAVVVLGRGRPRLRLHERLRRLEWDLKTLRARNPEAQPYVDAVLASMYNESNDQNVFTTSHTRFSRRAIVGGYTQARHGLTAIEAQSRLAGYIRAVQSQRDAKIASMPRPVTGPVVTGRVDRLDVQVDLANGRFNGMAVRALVQEAHPDLDPAAQDELRDILHRADDSAPLLMPEHVLPVLPGSRLSMRYQGAQGFLVGELNIDIEDDRGNPIKVTVPTVLAGRPPQPRHFSSVQEYYDEAMLGLEGHIDNPTVQAQIMRAAIAAMVEANLELIEYMQEVFEKEGRIPMCLSLSANDDDRKLAKLYSRCLADVLLEHAHKHGWKHEAFSGERVGVGGHPPKLQELSGSVAALHARLVGRLGRNDWTGEWFFQGGSRYHDKGAIVISDVDPSTSEASVHLKRKTLWGGHEETALRQRAAASGKPPYVVAVKSQAGPFTYANAVAMLEAARADNLQVPPIRAKNEHDFRLIVKAAYAMQYRVSLDRESHMYSLHKKWLEGMKWASWTQDLRTIVSDRPTGCHWQYLDEAGLEKRFRAMLATHRPDGIASVRAYWALDSDQKAATIAALARSTGFAVGDLSDSVQRMYQLQILDHCGGARKRMRAIDTEWHGGAEQIEAWLATHADADDPKDWHEFSQLTEAQQERMIRKLDAKLGGGSEAEQLYDRMQSLQIQRSCLDQPGDGASPTTFQGAMQSRAKDEQAAKLVAGLQQFILSNGGG